MEFQLSNFSPSDGIGECESIIKFHNFNINKGVILISKNEVEFSELLLAAVNYLCDEWDYAVERI